jgi:hypothetical protein
MFFKVTKVLSESADQQHLSINIQFPRCSEYLTRVYQAVRLGLAGGALLSSLCPVTLMTRKKPKTGYRRTTKSVKGRPRKAAEDLKRFQGTIKFDEQLEKALREEQDRRTQTGSSDSKATIMRSLIVKGLRDLGHDLDPEDD